MTHLTVPWPPTANNYKGDQVMLPSGGEIAAQLHNMQKKGLGVSEMGADLRRWLVQNARVSKYLTKEAEGFYWDVRAAAGVRTTLREDVRVTVELFPPDRRKRDLDNCFKCLFDGIESAGVVVNDYQIAELHSFRREPVTGGKVEIEIEEIPAAQPKLF